MLSCRGVFSARLNRPLKDRSSSGLSFGHRLLNRWPNRSVFSTGHRFSDLARDDLGLRSDYHLQSIVTGPNYAARAEGPERGLIDQGIVHYFKAQTRRAGVHQRKILVTT